MDQTIVPVVIKHGDYYALTYAGQMVNCCVLAQTMADYLATMKLSAYWVIINEEPI